MNSKPVELLAPAGSPEALAAAIANGADAVYMGGSQFSARAFAANFDDAAMEKAIRLAHLYGVNVYVTVNTLLDPQELEQALLYLRLLYEWGADAVIVQDLGLMRAARELIPGLVLHASTQMTIHNEWGVQFLRDAGVERVVLAREVSLAEIRAIGQKVPLPLEVFVHGALCFSYSGQCLLSSLIGGRSGNRGRCAQPCRLEYTLVDRNGHEVAAPGPHLISPSDLNMLASLPELCASGVAALKIEGRMKRPEYVATVVRVYRAALDRALEDPAGFAATRDELRDLEQIFNRGFTTGYFFERPGAALMSYQRPNNRGLLLGRVMRSPGERFTIRLEQPLRSGDGIEVWVTRGGRAGTEVGEMKVQGKTVTEAPAGAVVELPLPGRPASGDRVFKTSDSRLLSGAQESFSAAGPARPIPVSLHFSAHAGAPADLWIDDEGGHSAHVTGTFVVEPARKHPLSAEKAREQLTRLGGTVFSETSFDAKIDGEIMIPVSELNSMRRDAVEQLEKSRLAAWSRPPLPHDFRERVAALSGDAAPASHTGAGLSVAVADLESLKAALPAGPDRVYFGGESYRPKGRWTSEQMRAGIRECHEAGARAIVSLPRIVAERETQRLAEWVREITSMRPDGFLIRNPGQVELLRALWQGPVLADYPINVFNHQALETMGRIDLVTLSPELTLAQVGTVSSLIKGGHPDVTVEVLAHGAITLMVSEHCPLGALAGGGAGEQAAGCSMPCRTTGAGLRDRLGLVFPFRTDASCRMHLFNSMDLNMLADAPELAAWGLAVRVEGLAHEPRYVAEATRHYRARLKGGLVGSELARAQEDLQRFSPQGFTRGHYFRGV